MGSLSVLTSLLPSTQPPAGRREEEDVLICTFSVLSESTAYRLTQESTDLPHSSDAGEDID